MITTAVYNECCFSYSFFVCLSDGIICWYGTCNLCVSQFIHSQLLVNQPAAKPESAAATPTAGAASSASRPKPRFYNVVKQVVSCPPAHNPSAASAVIILCCSPSLTQCSMVTVQASYKNQVIVEETKPYVLSIVALNIMTKKTP